MHDRGLGGIELDEPIVVVVGRCASGTDVPGRRATVGAPLDRRRRAGLLSAAKLLGVAR